MLLTPLHQPRPCCSQCGSELSYHLWVRISLLFSPNPTPLPLHCFPVRMLLTPLHQPRSRPRRSRSHRPRYRHTCCSQGGSERSSWCHHLWVRISLLFSPNPTPLPLHCFPVGMLLTPLRQPRARPRSRPRRSRHTCCSQGQGGSEHSSWCHHLWVRISLLFSPNPTPLPLHCFPLRILLTPLHQPRSRPSSRPCRSRPSSRPCRSRPVFPTVRPGLWTIVDGLRSPVQSAVAVD
jgi:hypothetical protein